jgi:hypothetical protein
MKRVWIFVLAVGLLGGWIALREWSWHLENPVLAASVASPSTRLVAEAYLLNQGGGHQYGRGPAPYGIGVYLRNGFLPLKSFGSTLVFASYCGPEVHLAWPNEHELSIACPGEEAPRLLLPSHEGVKVTYNSNAPAKSS